MAVSPVLEAARAYRAELERRDAKAIRRLIAYYRQSWQRLEAMLNALLLEVGDQTPTKGQLVRMERYRALMQQIASELAGLETLTANEVSQAADLIELGEEHARELIAISLGRTRLAGMFHVLPRDAIVALVGFLDPGGPLYARLRQLAAVNAQYVADAIIQGITLGYNPRRIASLVRNAFGRGLTDALRFVRTAQLWAYREGNHASMIANRDILDGWVWAAHFDDRVCMSCVVMHGTVHAIDEVLNDHHNGRCVPVPLVRGFENPISEMGLDWFQRQDEATQRKLMGGSKYEAWKNGKISLEQLTEERRDDVYGMMRGEPSLKKLLEAMEVAK